MNDIKYIVAKNITALRQERKMTQLELAELLNYSDKAVSKWEHADSMPDIATLVDIANVFGVTLDYLVTEEHKKPKVEEKKKPRFNHGIIAAVSVALVWFIALLVFVLITLISGRAGAQWIAFVYAVPVSSIVYLVLNSIWFNRKYNYAIISVLMWSVLASIQLTFLLFHIDLGLLYALGVPGQIVIILWRFMRKPQNPEANSLENE